MPSSPLRAPTDGELTLSAILITKNEASNLRGCLETLGFCDEIIIVDNNSQDKTAEIAHEMGCKVIQTADWPGFGQQKQRALDQAHGEWILSIDADERVTESLAIEIKRAIRSEGISGFLIKRKSRFLGKWMRFGGWYPDYVLRLAKREVSRFDGRRVHEKLLVIGRIEKLDAELLHHSYDTVSEFISKQARYSILGAELIHEKYSSKSSKASIISATLRAIWTFLKLYLLQLGFLDGRHGFISASIKAQAVLWKYIAIEFEPSDRL